MPNTFKDYIRIYLLKLIDNVKDPKYLEFRQVIQKFMIINIGKGNDIRPIDMFKLQTSIKQVRKDINNVSLTVLFKAINQIDDYTAQLKTIQVSRANRSGMEYLNEYSAILFLYKTLSLLNIFLNYIALLVIAERKSHTSDTMTKGSRIDDGNVNTSLNVFNMLNTRDREDIRDRLGRIDTSLQKAQQLLYMYSNDIDLHRIKNKLMKEKVYIHQIDDDILKAVSLDIQSLRSELETIKKDIHGIVEDSDKYVEYLKRLRDKTLTLENEHYQISKKVIDYGTKRQFYVHDIYRNVICVNDTREECMYKMQINKTIMKLIIKTMKEYDAVFNNYKNDFEDMNVANMQNVHKLQQKYMYKDTFHAMTGLFPKILSVTIDH